MLPIKMIYQPTEKDKEMLVDVYAFHALPDYEGDYNHTKVYVMPEKRFAEFFLTR